MLLKDALKPYAFAPLLDENDFIKRFFSLLALSFAALFELDFSCLATVVLATVVLATVVLAAVNDLDMGALPFNTNLAESFVLP